MSNAKNRGARTGKTRRARTRPRAQAAGRRVPAEVEADDRRDRARKVLKSLCDPVAQTDVYRFVNAWLTFNTLYKSDRGADRDKICSAVQTLLNEGQAQRILEQTEADSEYYLSAPPLNMQARSSLDRSRHRAFADMAMFADTNQTASDRLAHLLCAVYQVRCNLRNRSGRGLKSAGRVRDSVAHDFTEDSR